jgi:regulator of sigma E protease
LITILAFIFVLGVLVFVHEFGHFLVARWHGVRVVTFSLGFGPKILKYQGAATEYCVSAVPLGGYVKLAGESTEDSVTGAPDEFLSKSRWVRFQVYLAGPVMNLLLAFFVLAGVLSAGADEPMYYLEPPLVGSLTADSPADRADLRTGDLILSVNGRSVPTWDAYNTEVLPRANRETTFIIERDGGRLEVTATPDGIGKYEFGELGIGPRFRPQLTQVNPGSPADDAGLQGGDVILAINGEHGLEYQAVIDQIRAHPEQPISLLVERAGTPVEVTAVPGDNGGIGQLGVLISMFEMRRIDPTLWEAFGLSARQNWDNTLLIGRTLRGLFTRETPMGQLMGPVAIAELSGSAASIGWLALLNLMAMISLNLGLLNLMPVPVLDGGHIAILAVEGTTRRDLSIRVKERILMAGAAVIVLLMVTVIYNDIARLLR